MEPSVAINKNFLTFQIYKYEWFIVRLGEFLISKNFKSKLIAQLTIFAQERDWKMCEFKIKQAGAELGQAQHKLGFDSTLIIYKFGFYRSSKKIIQWSPFGPTCMLC